MIPRKFVVGWIDLTKEVILLEVILVVNEEDKVVLTEQEGIQKYSRKRRV